MVQTEKVWAAADASALPRLVALNRLDRDRASLERSLASLRESCSRSVIPIQLPIGEEKEFRGVVDLVSKKAFLFKADGSGTFTEGAVPGRHDGRRRRRARGADRDGRRERREADGAFLRGRHADRRGAGRRPAERDAGRQAVPAGLHVGAAEHRRAAAARRDRRLPAVARRPPVQRRRQGRRRRRARGRREGPAVGVRLEDDRRSVRRPHHDVPRRLRRDEGRFDRAQQDARTRRSGSAT